MSQENLISFKCSVCKRRNYFSQKNKKKLQSVKLKLNKLCKWCKKHTPHTEAKITG